MSERPYEAKVSGGGRRWLRGRWADSRPCRPCPPSCSAPLVRPPAPTPPAGRGARLPVRAGRGAAATRDWRARPVCGALGLPAAPADAGRRPRRRRQQAGHGCPDAGHRGRQHRAQPQRRRPALALAASRGRHAGAVLGAQRGRGAGPAQAGSGTPVDWRRCCWEGVPAALLLVARGTCLAPDRALPSPPCDTASQKRCPGRPVCHHRWVYDSLCHGRALSTADYLLTDRRPLPPAVASGGPSQQSTQG